MQAQEEQLISAIVAAPNADTPRLALAKWLEEYGGQPLRAKFIRAQCESASLYDDDPKRGELIRFTEDVLRSGTSYPPTDDNHPYVWTMAGRLGQYERGFPTAFRCMNPTRVDDVEADLARYGPTVNKLRIECTHVKVGSFDERPISKSQFMSRITDLDLKVYEPDQYVSGSRLRLCYVLQSDHLTNVEVFSFSNQPFDRDATPGLTYFIDSCAEHTFSRLRTLNLSCLNMSTQALSYITDCDHLRKVVNLDISGNQVGDKGAFMIATSPNFEQLRQINVADTGMTSYGLRLLAEMPRLVRLEGHQDQWFWTRNYIQQQLQRHRSKDRGS